MFFYFIFFYLNAVRLGRDSISQNEAARSGANLKNFFPNTKIEVSTLFFA